MIRSAPSWTAIEAMSPADAAAFWLVRLDDDPTAGDRVLFERWLGHAEANALAWHGAQCTWTAFDDDPIFAEEAMQHLAWEARRLFERHSHPEPGWMNWKNAATSAVILIGLATAGFVWRNGIGPHTAIAAQPVADHYRFATRIGEKSVVNLADGTQIVLDTGTTIEASLTDHARDIRLVTGQAFFEVHHEAARPLRIAAGGQIVNDLGTKFNLSVVSGAMRLTLAEGSVMVAPADGKRAAVALVAGQELVVDRGSYRITRVDSALRSQWRFGLATFNGAPLSAVIQEFNRYGANRLRVTDPSIANLRISGVFRTTDPQAFAANIAQIYPVKARKHTDGAIEIVAR